MSGFFPSGYIGYTPAYETNQNGPSPANVIATPLTIQSDNKLKSAVFEVSNNAVLTITNSTDPTYADIAIQSSGNTYIQPQGAGKFVQVGATQVGGGVLYISGSGGQGRVYDNLYNKVATQQTVASASSGNIALSGGLGSFVNVVLPSAGYYVFELAGEGVVKTPGVLSFLKMYCTGSSGGSVINQTACTMPSSGFSSSAEASFVLTSGIFPANGAQTLRLYLDTVLDNGTRVSTPWTGEWELKITQIGTAV